MEDTELLHSPGKFYFDLLMNKGSMIFKTSYLGIVFIFLGTAHNFINLTAKICENRCVNGADIGHKLFLYIVMMWVHLYVGYSYVNCAINWKSSLHTTSEAKK